MPATTIDDRRQSGATVAFVNIQKRYGDVVALNQMSFDINSGEFFAILGPSGSGKSTLLGITAGFVIPTGGHLLLNGKNIIAQPPYKRNIGMVFQNYALFPYMTVAENIAFPLRMRRMPKSEIQARVGRMLDVVRLTGMEDRQPLQLSGGQQQRVALARAAVYDPLLLLMDEPLGALDKNLRETVQDEIRRFQKEIGATVIYVTHDQQEAAALADRMAIMRAGTIVQIGTPRELYDRPNSMFVASFLGEANVFRVVDWQRCDRGTILRTAGGLELRADEVMNVQNPVVVCVRPEAVRVSREAVAADNQFNAEVIDAVYFVGGFRYKVKLLDGSMMTLRQRTGNEEQIYAAGDKISVGWRAKDTLLIRTE